MRLLALCLALAACSKPPTARERILNALPSEESAIFVADGKSLGHPRFRPIVDALRPRWPASMGCVIDAGLASDEVGVAATKSGTQIAILAKHPAKCAALSPLGNDLYVATIGEGKFGDAAGNVAIDPHFARARKHLLAAPIAATLESARFSTTIHASARPDPLEAWVAFDADPKFADTLEAGVRALVERMTQDSSTNRLAARIAITRTGSQIVARASGAIDADLGGAAATLVTWGWGQTSKPAPTPWTCPALGSLVTGCASAALTVTSLQAVADVLAKVPLSTIVTNATVTGLRVDADLPALGLRRGDLVFACEGRPLANRTQLVDAIRNGPHEASITIRRDDLDTKVHFSTK